MNTAIQNKFSLALMSYLDSRRKEIGMSMKILSQRSALGMRTVQRALSGNEPNVTLNTVLSIADALKVELPMPREIVSAYRVRREQAERKATVLAATVQGTSALEAQAVPRKALLEIEEELADRLATGSRRQLWSN